MKIVLLDGYTINPGDLSWDALKEFGELTVYPRTEESKTLERIKDADIILTSKVKFSKNIIDAAPKLKMICVLATGYNNIDVSYAKEKGIAVTNIPAYSSKIVAQHTIALLLTLASSKNPPLDLQGKCLGIIGYGNISKEIIPVAVAFGMNVLISTRYPDNSVSEGIKFVSQEELFALADFISLHCPMTPENKGFINSKTIAQMKNEVFIINTSRGGFINSSDLANAIITGKIAGAGLDVLEQEPPTQENPLIGLENVFITPHIAWSGKQTRAGLIDTATRNIKGFLEGKPVNLIF